MRMDWAAFARSLVPTEARRTATGTLRSARLWDGPGWMRSRIGFQAKYGTRQADLSHCALAGTTKGVADSFRRTDIQVTPKYHFREIHTSMRFRIPCCSATGRAYLRT